MASNNKLLVNYLPYTMTKDEFRYMFAKVGDLKYCDVMRDPFTGKSMGYGFVKYHSSMDATRAQEILNGLKIENKTLKVSFALTKQRRKQKNKKPITLFVYNVASSIRSSDLCELFGQYGSVRHVNIPSGEEYAFVTMNSTQQAMAAIEALNLSKLHNRILQVRLKQYKTFQFYAPKVAIKTA